MLHFSALHTSSSCLMFLLVLHKYTLYLKLYTFFYPKFCWYWISFDPRWIFIRKPPGVWIQDFCYRFCKNLLGKRGRSEAGVDLGYVGVAGLMKNMQPDPGSNRGLSAYRANALPTELPDCLHIIHPVPVLTQVTPTTLLPPFLSRFDVEGVESHSFQRRTCTCSAMGGHGTKL